MVYGNPYYFGVWVDFIPTWNESFHNMKEGVFSLFINGDMLPSTLPPISTFLPHTVSSIENFLYEIDELENSQLFNMRKEDAYDFLFNTGHYRNPNITEQEAFDYWKYSFPDYIDDPNREYEIWYFCHNNQEKIIYFNDKKKCIDEIILDKGYIKSVLKQSVEYLNSKLE